MRKVIVLIVLAGVWVGGCNSGTNMATVVETHDMSKEVQNIAPTIPLLRSDGIMTTLAKTASPFYLVAFVEKSAEGADCIDPIVRKIARNVWLDSVSVAQITRPMKSKTTHAPKKCIPPKDNLILVRDPNRLAWEMFKKPAPGTLLLINEHGYIVESGSLSDSKHVLFKANQLSKEWDLKMRSPNFDDYN